MFFKKKPEKKTYDKQNQKPAIKASICNGEMVAGFINLTTGRFEDIMLVRNDKEIEEFMRTYDIEEKVEKIY